MIKYILVLQFLLCISPLLPAQVETAEWPQKLFASDKPLRFSLVVDIKTLKNDESENPEYTKGQMIWHRENEEDVIFHIEARARGKSRRLFDFCHFPPLKLNFKKKEVAGTLFEGQDKLKLVSYCRDVDLYQSYVLQEYLIYKLYNCLTPNSFRVRLAHITYTDLNDKSKEVTRYGFLIEDDDIMAARNGAVISETLLPHQDRCDLATLDIFTLFQYMIGNTDWWIAAPKMHNIKLIEFDGKLPVPVPYDFDYCGAINANYAVPTADLPIKSVRERYFIGYCRVRGGYETTVALFNEKRNTIYDLYRQFDLIDEKSKKMILAYFDRFYKTINNPKQLEKKIYNNCQVSHNHLHHAR
ncbi:MAG: hypothetical protein HC819_00575 [Cyclobacteriaceae bacterium]|nr:hypothetical protein [Cyclobacteriaceae bacterium]